MPSAACGPHALDKKLTIFDAIREGATHESMVAQSRTAERVPADRFQAQQSHFLSMPRNLLLPDRDSISWALRARGVTDCSPKLAK